MVSSTIVKFEFWLVVLHWQSTFKQWLVFSNISNGDIRSVYTAQPSPMNNILLEKRDTYHVPSRIKVIRAHKFKVVGKAFFQPDIFPPHRSHEIAEPLQEQSE